MTGTDNLSEMYDLLYDQADKVLKTHDPCQFIDGVCARNRDPFGTGKSKDGCCTHKCVHLGPDGCKTKSLRCKTFLCDYLMATLDTKAPSVLAAKVRYCSTALDVIDVLALNIFSKKGVWHLDYFQSKGDLLKKYKEDRKL